MKIFLSYSHKNRTEADYIDQILQSADYIIMRDIREVSSKGDLLNAVTASGSVLPPFV